MSEKQVDAPSTMDSKGNRKWLYPDRRPGPRASRRRLLAGLLILFYFSAPWISFHGRPLIRVDVLEQKASLFGLVLKMTEYNYIFFIFAVLGMFLFLVTTLRGRIWCGYACPQTVFVEWIIRPIEEFIEGPAAKRRRQDSGKKSVSLMLRKVIKQIMFLGVSVVVANAFLGYFIDPKLILKWITSPPSEHPTAFGFVMFITALMYFDLAWFREQFCAFLCPYARFQSIMLDDSTPSVNYVKSRGEPRGKGQGKGDCIDCGLCVRVCPTGIDIRNGLQLECIQCERCVDACDSIMANLKRPLGLVQISAPEKFSLFRPRVLVYSGMIAIIVSLGVLKLTSRDSLTLTALRQVGSPYTVMPDGRHANVFNVRVSNNSDQPIKLDLKYKENYQMVEMICPRCGAEIQPFSEMLTPLFVIFPASLSLEHVEILAVGQNDVHRLPILHGK